MGMESWIVWKPVESRLFICGTEQNSNKFSFSLTGGLSKFWETNLWSYFKGGGGVGYARHLIHLAFAAQACYLFTEADCGHLKMPQVSSAVVSPQKAFIVDVPPLPPDRYRVWSSVTLPLCITPYFRVMVVDTLNLVDSGDCGSCPFRCTRAFHLHQPTQF